MTKVETPLVLRTDEGAVRTLTLNRGERFSPLSSAMIAALQAELDAVAADESIRAIVLAALGRGFCAGHDLKEMRAHAGDAAWQRRLFDDCSRLMMTLTQIPQPVVARVHGLATAAGCQLVAMCDLAVASEAASFALPGITIGLFCSTPAVAVARNIGWKRAMELLLTGKPTDARTAQAWGLINRVVPAEVLDAEVRRFTDLIVAHSATTIALGKRTFYRQIGESLEAAYDVASEAMACNMYHEDAAAGIDAFLGKRSAD
jgi:enoyl-CoA hydratase/carnithine racemase